MSWRQFTFVKDTSKKFWNVELAKNAVTVHFGRIGASGRKQTKEFASSHKAQAAYERLIAEKLGEGYREQPAQLKETPAESLARTRYRVGQRWSFQTNVPNIHPVLQIIGVEEYPRKGIFCFLDVKFSRALTETHGDSQGVIPGIELSVTAAALDRSLDQVVDARAPLPEHYGSTGEFARAPESWPKVTADIGDTTLEEAILRHLGQAFPAKVAKQMGWPTPPKARKPKPAARELPPQKPQQKDRPSPSLAMAEAIARGDLKKVRTLVEASPAVVNTPLRIDPEEDKLNPAGTAAAPPLHFAVAHGKEKVVELLLELGARIDTTSQEGWTPLFVAARSKLQNPSRADRIAGVLERHGAAMDLTSALYLHRVDWVKQHLRTHKRAVQDALSPGNLINEALIMTEFRLTGGGDDDVDRESAEANAIYADLREIIELLLDRGADPNGADGGPLLYAVQLPDTTLAKLLLERGADPNRGLAQGDAVYLPDIASSEEMQKLLKHHGAKEDPYHPTRNYRAKGYVSIWLGRFSSKRKFTEYTTNPDDSDKVLDECFKEDFGVDIFDGISYEDDFSREPLAVNKLLIRFTNCDSFLPAAAAKAEAMRWGSANCASLMYDFRYKAASGKTRRDCPMTFLGAFPYWDEEPLEKLLDRGKFAQALAEINKAIERFPKSEYYVRRRGWIYEQLRKYPEAKADYEQAVRLGGNDPEDWSLNNLAWILATAPAPELRDAAKAVKLALRACELSQWKNPDYLGTLAAAYASNGQFDEAISWQKKALAHEKGKKIQAEIRAGLKLYRAGQPFRLPQGSE